MARGGKKRYRRRRVRTVASAIANAKDGCDKKFPFPDNEPGVAYGCKKGVEFLAFQLRRGGLAGKKRGR